MQLICKELKLNDELVTLEFITQWFCSEAKTLTGSNQSM